MTPCETVRNTACPLWPMILQRGRTRTPVVPHRRIFRLTRPKMFYVCSSGQAARIVVLRGWELACDRHGALQRHGFLLPRGVGTPSRGRNPWQYRTVSFLRTHYPVVIRRGS